MWTLEIVRTLLSVFLSQASWTVTMLIHRSLLSQRFKDGPVHISRTFSLCSSLLPAFQHANFSLHPPWLPIPVLAMFCRNCFQAVVWGSYRIYLICISCCLLSNVLKQLLYIYILFPSCFPVFVFSNEYKFKLWYNLLGSESFVFVILILYIKYYQVL